MSSLSDVVEAVKATNKTVEDTGLFVADYITDELKKTTGALKNVDPVGIDSTMFTTLGQQICDAIIFQTDYLDNTLQKMQQAIVDSLIFQTDYLDDTFQKVGQDINGSIEKATAVQEKSNEDNSGREIRPLTGADIEEATVEANKSFFGSGFGKSFLSFAETVSANASKKVGKIKDVAMKPVLGIFDRLKEVFSKMAEIFLAVGFVKFLQGWEKASEWFGENASFGEKLSAGLASLVGYFTGLTDGETAELAKTFANIWNFISGAISKIVDTIGIIPTVIGGLLLYLAGPSGIIAGIKLLGSAFMTIGSFLAATLMPVITSIGTFFTGTLMPVLAPILGVAAAIVAAAGVLYTVIKGVVDGFEAAQKAFADTGSVFEAVKAFTSGFLDSITGTIKSFFTVIWDGMKSALSKTIEWINSNVIKYLPKVPYIKDPFGGGAGSSPAEAAVAPPPAATPATPTRAQNTTEAAKVADQSKSNAAAKETATAPVSAASNNSVVTQVNNNANNKTVYGMKFETKPGIGNSTWAVSHAMP